MTAPEPHIPPAGRLRAPRRRDVASADAAPEPTTPDAPLTRALRATAAQRATRPDGLDAPSTPRRWRRPERHLHDQVPVVAETGDAAGSSSAEAADPPAPDAGSDVPPILARLLAERGRDLHEPEGATDGAPDGTPAVEPPAHQTTDALPVDQGDALAAAENAAEALPFARLAALPVAQGDPEPPLCHPRAAIVSRARPLSALRPAVRHARRPRRLPWTVGLAAASAAVVAAVSVATTALATTPAPASAAEPPAALSVTLAQDPPPILSLDDPAPAVVASVAMCDMPEIQAGLSAGDPVAVIAAAGGAAAFHDAITAGAAPCLSLADSAWPWVVVNKQRANAPADFTPASVVLPDGVASLAGGGLRPDAAAALTAMVDASRAAGAGDMAVQSAYRSFTTQTETHDAQVAANGADLADESSARPGYSEHQTGLAADLVACDDAGCGSLDDFGATAQGQWVAANAWQFGWVVRYESDATPVTGYVSEPWHLRYVGPELATLYHDGGFHTLEEFWGLAAAPTY